MGGVLDHVTPVLLAKLPQAGTVKTRLVARGAGADSGVVAGAVAGAGAGEGGLSEPEAAEVAWAMLLCTAWRLEASATGRLVIAVSPDRAGADLAARLGFRPAALLDQGAGDLGERLARIWRRVRGPVAFFGGDAPDVPRDALAAIPAALSQCDLAIGPTHDGGYWTLAARSRRPEVVSQIDWGGPNVYDQTRQRARDGGLSVLALPTWHDVDRPEDLAALRRRLRAGGHPGSRAASDEAPLRRLAERLDELLPLGDRT